MAETQSEKVEERSVIKKGYSNIKSIFKNFLINLGFPVHIAPNRIIQRINSELNLGMVGN